KPWFTKEGDIIDFPKKKDNIIKLPNVGAYPNFLTGVEDLQSRVKKGELSDEMYKKLYTELLHRFMRRESAETPWFMREAPRGPKTPVDYLKIYVDAVAEKAGLKLGSSSRHETHTRFAFPGELKDYQKFFQPIGITVAERDTISGSFETYTLTTTKPIKVNDKITIPAGTQLPWVNNWVGKDSRSGKTFSDKDLTPESVGLAGARLDAKGILSKISTGVKGNEAYVEYAPQLLALAKKSQSLGNSISLSGVDISNFSMSDLATISKNFGEVLASIWSITNLKYEKILFPKTSNARMIDFYGELDGSEYPVSVKSGTTGGKVSVGNLYEALQDKVRQGKIKPDEEKAYNVFEMVTKNSMPQGIISLHKYFKTQPIQDLARLVGVPVENLDSETLLEWLKSFQDAKSLQKKILPWHKKIKKDIKDKTWDYTDRRAIIIGPLGQWILDFLNNSEEVRGSLTRLAQQLSIIQVNVNVKKLSMTFQYNRFEDANFYFNWAGYQGGNRIGFNMDLGKVK
ncbi:MAG: hypothetical protein ACO3H5_07350, partial [Candidatus Nanopelagicales bacterium]